MDLNILGEIMRGGAEKVIEAGGTLAGGHSIADSDVKYGLSVTGIVNPNKIYTNNGTKPGDALILTKRLGVGIICTANRVGEASVEAMKAVTDSMTTLNKYAAECCRNFEIHACTDVTGFSFLGHLHEMMDGQLSCHIHAKQVPVFEEALRHADEFLLTAAGQRNRNLPVHLFNLKVFHLLWKKFFLTLRHPVVCSFLLQKKMHLVFLTS